MEVLNPDLVWIDGICCRVRFIDQQFKHEEQNITFDNQEKSTFSYDVQDDEEEDSEEEIYTNLSNGRVKVSIPIAQCFLGYVIGTKGATKKRIENETRTDIKIPLRGQGGNVTITGSERKNVSKALRRIKLIIIGARQKQTVTHFLSIPMNADVMKENYKKFMNEILESPWAQNINPEIFTSPEKLHITLFVMFLVDEEERNTAKDALEKCKSSIIKEHFENIKGPYYLKVKGVSYMNDDPKAVKVLYANVLLDNDELHLEDLVIKLKETFNKTGYLIRSRDFKVHVTLMNTKRLSEDEEISKESKRKTFDASQILEKYQDFEFGMVPIKEIHLSLSRSTNQDGYYQSTHVIEF